jgi:RsmE family RNA methyltransferase
MNRLILLPEQLQDDGSAVLTPRQTAHVTSVLKLKTDDTLRVGVLNGARGQARVNIGTDETIRVHCALEDTPPPPLVDLLLAMPRPKVMKRLWPVLASLGVGHIKITNAARVERQYFDTQWLSPEFYTPSLIEGLEQSGDTHLPTVSVERRFKPFIEDALDKVFPDTTRLIGDPYGRGAPNTLTPTPHQRILVAIGPEGGWDDFECNLLAEHGFKSVDMGWRILRSDTACVALLTLAHEWTRPR